MDKNTKVIIGVGLAVIGTALLLRKAGAASGAFTFGTPTVQMLRDSSNYPSPLFTCQITGPGTHHLQLMEQIYDRYTGSVGGAHAIQSSPFWYQGADVSRVSFDLVLASGENLDYVFDGTNPFAISYNPNVSTMMDFHYRLQDELGNKSAEAVMST